jgi:type IV pilus assembly protein PilM
MNKVHPGSKHKAGMECGVSGAKLVLLTRADSTFRVDHIFLEEYPFEARSKGKSRLPVDMVRRLIIHKNLAGYQTFFTAAGAVKSCFLILPKMSKAEMAGAILLQARKTLAWEGADPLLAYVTSDFLGNQTGNLVGLADWPAVKRWCELIEAGGGDIGDLTLEAYAYLALAQQQNWMGKTPVFLVADLGAEASSFYIFDHQSLRFMRKIPVGGDAITKMLTTEVSTDAGPIQLSELEAEEVKITGRLPEATKREMVLRPIIDDGTSTSHVSWESKFSAHMEVLMRPLIERLSSELARSIQFYKDNTGQKVEGIYLAGGTAALPAIKTYLETSLALPVMVVDPFAGMIFASAETSRQAEKNRSRLAMAVGLALVEEPDISLLPKHMKLLKKLLPSCRAPLWPRFSSCFCRLPSSVLSNQSGRAWCRKKTT